MPQLPQRTRREPKMWRGGYGTVWQGLGVNQTHPKSEQRKAMFEMACLMFGAMHIRLWTSYAAYDHLLKELEIKN